MVADIDITKLIEFHRKHGKKATVTATHPSGRFGALEINEGKVKAFQEKPKGDGGVINGGYFVLSPSVIDLIDSDKTIWEQEPLTSLSAENQLMAFEHSGFWQPMDTLRDKRHLEKLWEAGEAPWKVW